MLKDPLVASTQKLSVPSATVPTPPTNSNSAATQHADRLINDDKLNIKQEAASTPPPSSLATAPPNLAPPPHQTQPPPLAPPAPLPSVGEVKQEPTDTAAALDIKPLLNGLDPHTPKQQGTDLINGDTNFFDENVKPKLEDNLLASALGNDDPRTPNTDGMPPTPGGGGPTTPGGMGGAGVGPQGGAGGGLPPHGSMPPNAPTPGMMPPNTPTPGMIPPGAQPGGPGPPHPGGMMGGPGGPPPSGMMGGPGGPPMDTLPVSGAGGPGYMQQQSHHIFVFNTSLANKAAEAVNSGQIKSIIAYHVEQPQTQQFLQKHPLNKAQFMRPQQYMPRGPVMGPGGIPHNGPMPPMKPGDNSMNTVAQWVQQQNENLQQEGVNFSTNSMNPPFSPTGQTFGPGGPSPVGPWPPGQGPPPQGMQSPEFMMDGGGPGGFPPGQPGFNMMDGGVPMSQANLTQNKVPNENLTQEQLQRREESLANLRKIQQMLFPDQRQGGMMPKGPGGPPGPGGMMHPGMMGPDKPMGPGMGPGMMPGGPMGPNNPQMMGGPGEMMPMGLEGPMGPQGQLPHPPNWDSMNPAQREWFKLQQDFYMNKRRRMQMEQMKRMEEMRHMQMGMRPGAPGGPGPPPPYGMGAMRRPGIPGAPSPTSPNGPHMDSSSHPSPAPSDPFMFPGGQPRHPAMMGGPQGPRMPGFEGPMMDPNMPGGGMFDPRAQHPGGKIHMMQMAGNPEQFNPDAPGPGTPSSQTSGANARPPPSYSSSLKRKRSAGGGDDDELHKKLQPAPSPQQFSYLHQFDGQELTITKQLNVAYKETNDSSPATTSQPNSVLNEPRSVQSPSVTPNTAPTPQADRMTPATTASSTASPHPATPSFPQPPTPTSSIANPTTSVATSASTTCSAPSSTALTTTTATQRLSHIDPPMAGMANNKNNAAMGNITSNITSASLANLAKGVEHLSNQMQQNMMQGGPFHNIQIQGQMSEINDSVQNGANASPPGAGGINGDTPVNSSAQQQMPSDPSTSNTSAQNQPPSVNNTYVNANLSIQQLNIQSVNQSGPGGVATPAMQVQQMTADMSNVPPGPNMSQASGAPNQQQPPNSSQMPTSMQSVGPMTPTMSQASMGQGFFNDPMAHKMGMAGGPRQPVPPHSMSSGPGMPMPVPGGGTNARPPPAQSPSGVMIGSPGYRPSSTPVGNANVQIQAKAPNTIQYLPANPPTSHAGPMNPQRTDMPPDMMGGPRFMPPSPNMDLKLSGGPMNKLHGGGGLPQGPPHDMMVDRMGMPVGSSAGGMPPSGMQHMGAPGRPGMPGGPNMPGNMPPGNMSMQQQQMMMQANGPRMQAQMSAMQFGRPSPGPAPNMGGPGPGMGGPPTSMGMMPPDMMQGQQMQGQNMMQMQSMGGGPPIRGDMPGGPMPGGPMPGGPMPGGPMHGQPPGGFNPQYSQQFSQQMYGQGGPMMHGPNGPGPGGMPGPGQRPMSPEMQAMMHVSSAGPMPPGGMGPMGPGPALPMGPPSGGTMMGPGLPGPMGGGMPMNQYGGMMP